MSDTKSITKVEPKVDTIEEKFDKALGILVDQIRANLKPAEQLQQTQAVLNMVHAKTQLEHAKIAAAHAESQAKEEKPKTTKQGAGT